ncbi:DUF6942 family protein [Gilvimarinus chinensis]|uniref:DUF6942 family protein n=1 Tax=Gilvimarinus chinensis TaxID=396005 RepID=UPI0003788C30|nr:hypothetical protein [Gilvimarinus chinensis]
MGLGDVNYRIAFCIANRPALDHYPQLNNLAPLAPGELEHIVANSSNHWRKLFSVYAKFIYQLGPEPGWPERWQDYRDHYLLQADSKTALLFSSPPPQADNARIHIVAGKTYAAELNVPGLEWQDAYFAVNKSQRLIVSPYLDYRQLSNERIGRLVQIVKACRH